MASTHRAGSIDGSLVGTHHPCKVAVPGACCNKAVVVRYLGSGKQGYPRVEV